MTLVRVCDFCAALLVRDAFAHDDMINRILARMDDRCESYEYGAG